MASDQATSILRRKTAAPSSAGPPAAVTRMIRNAAARGAEAATGLIVAMTALADTEVDVDALLARIHEDDLVLLLAGPEEGAGLALVDPQLLTALIEFQTTGRVTGVDPAPRERTPTDAAMAVPLIEGLLGALIEEDAGGALAALCAGWQADRMAEGARGAELVLEPLRYRMLDLTLDCAGGTRRGRCVLALPLRALGGDAAAAGGAGRWADRLEKAVLRAPADVHAVLHRTRMPLAALHDLAEGDLLPLPRSAIGKVRIETSSGQVVAHGRLGQLHGMRAVRLLGREEQRPPVAAPPEEEDIITEMARLSPRRIDIPEPPGPSAPDTNPDTGPDTG